MATNNNTVLYFETSSGENIAIRADEITGIGSHGGKAQNISIFFEGIDNVNGGEIRLGTVTNGKEREVVECLIRAINNGKNKYIDVVNPTTKSYAHELLENNGVDSILLDNQYFTPEVDLSESAVTTQNHTLTAANILGGIIKHTSTTGAGTITFPSHTVIKEAFTPNLVQGDVVELIYVNDGDQNVTFAEDTGATVSIRNGSSPTIAANSACKIVIDIQALTTNVYILA